MTILGIDPGTATTGYGLVRENASGQPEAVAYGVITTPAGLPMPERLVLIYQELKQIILLHRPASSAVEKLFFHRNVTTAIAVGQARGVVLLALAEAGISVFEYTPLEVKQAAVGYGNAEKKQVQMMMKALLNLEDIPRPDDAADALAIAFCHLNSLRFRSLT
ncbi:MAG TPA: crossover junction endodeoxyribonuclease RuvC [Anaerolineaceae bacterium]|nr:crossover junction endodeoxyribonuclease RuvC [Anaerolineaceae bacterium]HPN51053.1 crossover junction endodeoxyribonuclease RuvC [Anaerolineaceae bacterium]